MEKVLLRLVKPKNSSYIRVMLRKMFGKPSLTPNRSMMSGTKCAAKAAWMRQKEPSI
jgi:hypothetical protein